MKSSIVKPPGTAGRSGPGLMMVSCRRHGSQRGPGRCRTPSRRTSPAAAVRRVRPGRRRVSIVHGLGEHVFCLLRHHAGLGGLLLRALPACRALLFRRGLLLCCALRTVVACAPIRCRLRPGAVDRSRPAIFTPFSASVLPGPAAIVISQSVISPLSGSAATCPRNPSRRFDLDLRVCRAWRSTVLITRSGTTFRAIRHRPSVPSESCAGSRPARRPAPAAPARPPPRHPAAARPRRSVPPVPPARRSPGH